MIEVATTAVLIFYAAAPRISTMLSRNLGWPHESGVGELGSSSVMLFIHHWAEIAQGRVRAQAASDADQRAADLKNVAVSSAMTQSVRKEHENELYLPRRQRDEIVGIWFP